MNIAMVAGVVAIALIVIVWMIWQNRSDRRDLQEKLNRDYPAPRPDKQDPDAEEPTK